MIPHVLPFNYSLVRARCCCQLKLPPNTFRQQEGLAVLEGHGGHALLLGVERPLLARRARELAPGLGRRPQAFCVQLFPLSLMRESTVTVRLTQGGGVASRTQCGGLLGIPESSRKKSEADMECIF